MRFQPFLMRFAAVVAFSLAITAAHAKPEYAQREQKACSYCHVSPSPGAVDPKTKTKATTARNERGIYYASHNYSFKGFVDRKPQAGVGRLNAPKTGQLNLKFQWKEDFDDLPRRMAVADVVGDGKLRLVTLHEKDAKNETSQLMVRRWDGKTFVKEFETTVQASPDRLQVGKFAGQTKPAVILTGDAVWYWDGKKFARKASTTPLPLFGIARNRDGSEVALIATRPDEVKAHRVTLDKEAWLSNGFEPPNSHTILWGDMHATAAFFELMGLESFGNGGLIGVWDYNRSGKTILYYARVEGDIDIDPASQRNRERQPKFVVKNRSYFVSLFDPNLSVGNELWLSPQLPGPVLDIAIESGRNDEKAGLLLLIGEREKGKSRTIAFFSLEPTA